MSYKQGWLETAISIHKFHIERLRLNERWRIEDTAKLLNRSFGCVAQYLKIANFLKTHEVQLRRQDTMKEALALIKKIERHQEIQEINL